MTYPRRNYIARAAALGFTEKGMSFREVLFIASMGVAYIIVMWLI